jgi:rhodanese-related sulfurtransferase
MSKPHRRIDLFANVAIIFVALLLCFVLAEHYFAGGRKNANQSNPDPRVPAGTKISLPDGARLGDRTLLLVLSTKCHYCSESAPFYRRLVGALEGQADTKLVAVLPEEVSEGEEYLKKLGVLINDVKQTPLELIHVSATPTLLLLDKSGTVTHSWLGKLAAEEEDEVLSALQGGVAKRAADDEKITSLEAADLQGIISSRGNVAIIDVRERSEYRQKRLPHALNIPLDELSVRAPDELRQSDLIVVYSDCARCANDEKGQAARRILNDLGFRRAVVLRGGIESWEQAHLPVINS